MYDEDTGAVEFLEFPLEPHEALIFEFNTRFSMQFLLPWEGTLFHPVFEGLGFSSKPSQHHFVSKANVVDFWYPGRKKSPNASFRPYPRLNPAILNSALVRLQLLFAKPWPSVYLEVGSSKRVPDTVLSPLETTYWAIKRRSTSFSPSSTIGIPPQRGIRGDLPRPCIETPTPLLSTQLPHYLSW